MQEPIMKFYKFGERNLDSGNNEQRYIIQANESKFLRLIAGYRRKERKSNRELWDELKIYSVKEIEI